jgi:ABC-type multidrug transport system ATPase subunit/ABC-type transporter Mla maintaining outer membrane lipid asymmetry permease subunit MlaE
VNESPDPVPSAFKQVAGQSASGVNSRPSPLPLYLRDLTISAGSTRLLEQVSLNIPAGKITLIVGPSGAGKSVLLRTIAGLLPREGPQLNWTGSIGLSDQPASEASWSIARRVGIVFQQFALFDELSPMANVQFAIDHRAEKSQPPSQSATQWLDELGVPHRTRVSGLSGGQKQRLAIARTLAGDPPIVLYDEPTSGLDVASGAMVAKLIQETHQAHRRTSIIVTHDYETLLPIAEEVLLLDPVAKTLERLDPSQWRELPSRLTPAPVDRSAAKPETPLGRVREVVDQFLESTGAALVASLRLPFDALPWFPHGKWGLRFFAHYLRLVGGPSAWIYLILAGLIIGFTSTYFTFRFLPFRLYTQPLLIDELLASIGFALYRVLVPVLATILIAARCGAAITADVAVKQYGGQVDAMLTLGIQPKSYLLVPILLAFLVATPMLEWLAFSSARTMSLFTFTATHPENGPYFWGSHFFRNLVSTPVPGRELVTPYIGWKWVLLKNLLCGGGTAAIGYHRGLQPKHSASDVSHAITSTVLWATLYVLVVHFVVALFEYR